MRRGAFLATAFVLGCGGSEKPPQSAPAATLDPNAAPALPDSLAIRSPNGTEIWFTLARTDHDSSGTACVDRTIEIRREGTRVAVPLLYTEEAPTFVNDSTLGAMLYRACRPFARYRVNARTGHPTPVGGS